jgi:hypothetical protein
MEVSAKDQDKVRNGIQALEGFILKLYKDNRITHSEREDAFNQLKRIDKVCNARSQNS